MSAVSYPASIPNMLPWIKSQWRDLPRRKMWIVAVSASLIIAAIVFGKLFERDTGHDVFMALAAVVAGTDVAIRAVRALKYRQVTIELLVTIAAGGALIIGEYWEAAAVTFLFVFGSWLEARTLNRTRSSLQSLMKLTPSTALVMVDDALVEKPLWDVSPGDLVQVRAGDSIPVDGVIVSGVGAVNEAAITGESMPVEKAGGDRVYSGSVSQGSSFLVRTESVGSETILGRIISRVEEAQDAKAPVQTTIERFARWYTPAIIVLAAFIWLLTRNVHLALTILVIGCPGAMVIATPVAFVAGIGRAAGFGILVKGGEYLEKAAHITTVAFDKTGTLTEGRPQLTDIVPLAGTDESQIIEFAAIAQTGSSHPLALPVLAAATERGINPSIAGEHETIPGRGVTATTDTGQIAIGTIELMTSLGIEVSTATRDLMEQRESEGKTVSLLAVNNELIGLLAFQDTPRPSARNLVQHLHAAGVKRVAMLTGDSERAAHAVAEAVGVDHVQARMLPEDKLSWIQAAQAKGETVAMVGDGINDAPALAAADISIAMGAAGSDIALDTASIALMQDDPRRIVDTLRISRRTREVIWQNLVIAIGTVFVLLIGVLMQRVHMAGGMLVHEASVMIVILNAMRLMRA